VSNHLRVSQPDRAEVKRLMAPSDVYRYGGHLDTLVMVSDKTRVRSLDGGPLWIGVRVELGVPKEGGVKCSIAPKNHHQEGNL